MAEQTTQVEGIELAILSGVAPEQARALVAGLSRHMRVPCYVLSATGFQPRYVEGREQLDADELLAWIENGADHPDRLRVGVTGIDIGNPIFTYFFGRARRHGRGALVSLCRLDPAFYGLSKNPGLIVARAVIEIRHELGHVAGLDHCRDLECLMRFASTVEAIDQRGRSFCPECADRLPHWLR